MPKGSPFLSPQVSDPSIQHSTRRPPVLNDPFVLFLRVILRGSNVGSLTTGIAKARYRWGSSKTAHYRLSAI